MFHMFHAVGPRSMSAVVLAAAALGAGAGSANAALAGESNAYGLSAEVNLVGTLIGINVGPLPIAAGSAPSPYDTSISTLTAAASFALVGSLSTGVLNAHATSDITSMSVTGGAAADSSVDGLSLVVVPGVLLTPDLVNLSATTIASSAQVSFDGTNVVTTGGFTIEDMVLSVGGTSIALNANAAPNTVLLDAAGIRIVLNEQIVTTLGDVTSLEVNALHITIDSPLQLVSADVVIAHSFASMTVPAPAAAGLMGMGGLVALRRRR